MDIIEKETIKEVPIDYWCDKYDRRWYNKDINVSNFASKGVAGTGLGLGIAGTALGLLALSRNNGFNLFGNNASMPENININGISAMPGFANSSPTTFQVWAKESEDMYNAQKALYDYALLDQTERFNDRQTLNSELFGVYKSQIDADFLLYKDNRNAFDAANNRITDEMFKLYKETRDQDDSIRQELSNLKAQVAINSAIRPYQDALIQCEIDKKFNNSINYTNEKTCNVLYGSVVLPSTPTITGYVGANQCGCPTIVSIPTTTTTT